jgi:hypothetical protein
MNYRFTEGAKRDLADAAYFYDAQRAGLGLEFAIDVGLSLARVIESPTTWPEIDPGFRRYRLDRFPFALVYRIVGSRVIEIIAVFDLRSRPGSWRGNVDR